MSKFIIECPNCGALTEASNGLFAKKKIECRCGYVIDVKKDKVTIKTCENCGNSILYDQSKGDKALCPVCHKPLMSPGEMNNYVHIHCPSCSCEITIVKGESFYECPLCGEKIDVKKELAKDQIKSNKLPIVIKYEGGNDTLVWKYPIEDFVFGSQLIVHESQEAIFFRDGKALDSFGPGRYTLETGKLPLLGEIESMPFKNEVFHSEVYFVNMVVQTNLKWGTNSKIRVFDPTSGLHVELGACGEFNLAIKDARKLLIKLVGTTEGLKNEDVFSYNQYSSENFSGKFKGLLVSKIKSNLAKIIRVQSINVLEIDEHIDDLSLLLRKEIEPTFEEYGLTIPEFYITNIVTPDDDPNFVRMKQQYAEQYLLVKDERIKKDVASAAQQRKIVEAQTAAQEEIIAAQGKAEAYRLQAEAEAKEMEMKGYTYQQETQRKVSVGAVDNKSSGLSNNSGSPINDIIGLGVALGTVGGVVGLTKDALKPCIDDTKEVASNLKQSVIGNNTWDCTCGQNNISSNYCPNCGKKRGE